MGIGSNCNGTKSRKRSSRGATLTEMLVATLLLGLTMAAIGEVMVITTLSATKLSNRTVGINDVRTVSGRIMKDVRSSSNFGDSYDTVNDSQATDRNGFPCTDNPLYSAGGGPSFTSTRWSWNGWPTDWPTPPYTLDAQTLIIQKPKLFEATDAAQEKFNGFPLMLERGKIQAGGGGATPIPANNSPNLDTIVYRLIQDPDEASEYILQRAVFVGSDDVDNLPAGGSAFSTMINPPQTVIKGIIGPKPAAGGTLPEIFTYYEKDISSTNITREIAPAAFNANPDLVRHIVGVGVDIELKKPEASTTSNNAPQQQRLGIHTESFLRSGRGIGAVNPN